MFDQNIIEEIRTALLKRRESIAVAESVTSGLLQVALSTAMDASAFYQGGITAYNIGQKARHLRIDPVRALTCNCVSQKMADDMARNVAELFSCDWAIGVTGYASPVPESDAKTFAYFAIANTGTIRREGIIDFGGADPFEAQLHYTNYILAELAAVLRS